MTEVEWLTCNDPKRMIVFAIPRLGSRKLRLCSCGLARSRWNLLTQPARDAISIAEWYADGESDEVALRNAEVAATPSAHGGMLFDDDAFDELAAAVATAFPEASAFRAISAFGELEACHIIRDIIGNPFRPLDGQIQTTEALRGLAREMYATNAFDRMPELGATLRAAGCTEPVVLEHCRSPHAHFRGCWLVDAILGLPAGETVVAEATWMVTREPERMLAWLDLLSRPVSERKRSLYRVACCRKLWPYFPDVVCCHALLAAERFADTRPDADELHEIRAQLAACSEQRHRVARLTRSEPHYSRRQKELIAISAVLALVDPTDVRRVDPEERVVAYLTVAGVPSQKALGDQADLLREILGNPFQPVMLDAQWRSDTALSLAKHIYEARDFAQMPILADALQDADCDNADILNHCRQPSEHVRGCWVVDLVLGKE